MKTRIVPLSPAGCLQLGSRVVRFESVMAKRFRSDLFRVYDENFDTEEKEQIITEDVISFLATLFSDRVVLYRTSSKGMGGWTVY